MAEEGGVTVAAPTSPAKTEKQISLPQPVEATRGAGHVLETAHTLLSRPEANMWADGPWHLRTETAKRLYGKRDISETFIGTKDTDSNTSFMVHQGLKAGEKNTRYTMIRWANFPDQPGGFVKGGGYIRYEYGLQGEVMKVETGKWQAAPREEPYNDAAWFGGGASSSALTHADLKETPFLTGENPLTDTELADIEMRFQRSTAHVDAAFSERAANYAKIDDRMSQAAYNYAEALRSGNPHLIEVARQQHLAAVDEYYIATDRNPEEERKKRAAIETEIAQSHTNEMSTLRTRGIVPQEILDDPDFLKIREEVQTKLVPGGNGNGHSVIIPEDEIDRRAVEAYQALVAKRAELQQLSQAPGAEAATPIAAASSKT